MKNLLKIALPEVNNELGKLLEKSLILQSQLIASNNLAKSHIQCLKDIEFQVFSQWGEDGIIDWLVSKCLEASNIPEKFIEIGVQNYKESNTRYLLLSRNWNGLIIDSSESDIKDIKNQDLYWRHNIFAQNTFVTRENINEIIPSSFRGDIGLLSIDIDGNDYWIWQEIKLVSPIIVICEYNAVLGDKNKLSVPYNKHFFRTNMDPSNLYFGASIKALIALGREKGYQFIGTNSSGLNAFFVREDFSQYILSKIDSILAFPSKFRESRNSSGNLTFLSGIDRSKAIENKVLYSFDRHENIQFKDLDVIYSNDWENGNATRIDGHNSSSL